MKHAMNSTLHHTLLPIYS